MKLKNVMTEEQMQVMAVMINARLSLGSTVLAEFVRLHVEMVSRPVMKAVMMEIPRQKAVNTDKSPVKFALPTAP